MQDAVVLVKTIPLAVTIYNVHITNTLQQSCESKSKMIFLPHNKFKILDGSHQFSRILLMVALPFVKASDSMLLAASLIKYLSDTVSCILGSCVFRSCLSDHVFTVSENLYSVDQPISGPDPKQKRCAMHICQHS